MINLAVLSPVPNQMDEVGSSNCGPGRFYHVGDKKNLYVRRLRFIVLFSKDYIQINWGLQAENAADSSGNVCSLIQWLSSKVCTERITLDAYVMDDLYISYWEKL